MILGTQVKKAIEDSEFSTEEVADYIGMSAVNFYKIYKKESFKIKYLITIAEKLNLPLGHFLNKETIGAITQGGSGNLLQSANNVGKNRQQISVGADDDFQKQLEALQREYKLLEKTVAYKEMITELLRGQKQG